MLHVSGSSRAAAARDLVTDCTLRLGLSFGRFRDLLTAVQPLSSSFASVGSGRGSFRVVCASCASRTGVTDGLALAACFRLVSGVISSLAGTFCLVLMEVLMEAGVVCSRCSDVGDDGNVVTAVSGLGVVGISSGLAFVSVWFGTSSFDGVGVGSWLGVREFGSVFICDVLGACGFDGSSEGVSDCWNLTSFISAYGRLGVGELGRRLVLTMVSLCRRRRTSRRNFVGAGQKTHRGSKTPSTCVLSVRVSWMGAITCKSCVLVKSAIGARERIIFIIIG